MKKNTYKLPRHKSKVKVNTRKVVHTMETDRKAKKKEWKMPSTPQT